MAWGTLTIGALALKERDIITDVTNANTGERSVRVDGAETTALASGVAALEAKQADIMGLIGRVFPVTFERKASYNGFYAVADTNTEWEKWVEGPAQIRWSLALDYIGPENALDFESRLGTVVRLNDFSLTGERWHAPAQGHYGYQVGTSAPSTVSRTGQDGAIIVYRSIPANLNPIWGCPVAGYQGGRARISDSGIERVGVNIPLSTTGWEISNGLIRVGAETVGTATLRAAAWTGGAWRNKAWDVRVVGTTLDDTGFNAVTVIRNDAEMCIVRVFASIPATRERFIMDLGIRRGSRFIEGFVQRPSSGGIDVVMDTLETYTDNTASGYVIATANDANGNRWAVGSSRTVTASVLGGITRSATTTLDFWLGAEVAGTGAVAGDTATDMRNQYIGAMTEKVGVIRR